MRSCFLCFTQLERGIQGGPKAFVSMDYLSFVILLVFLPARAFREQNGHEFFSAKIESREMSEVYIFGHIQKAVSFLLHLVFFFFSRQAVDFLSNEGHIYSTVDDDHFKSTDAE